MTATPDRVIEELRPSASGPFAAADLDPLEPLWRSLMDRHREVWKNVPMRTYADSWPRRRREYLDWLAAPGSFALVARAHERLVGYAVVGVEAGDETYATGQRQAEIHTLVVEPSVRGRGIGGTLVDEIERRLTAVGISDIFVGTMHGNDAAERFYARRGFSRFVVLNHRRLRQRDRGTPVTAGGPTEQD
jgi:ribosomal protein S18 acetylase RimI-like enzyme